MNRTAPFCIRPPARPGPAHAGERGKLPAHRARLRRVRADLREEVGYQRRTAATTSSSTTRGASPSARSATPITTVAWISGSTWTKTASAPARQDQDTNGDGEKDRWVTFRDGKPRASSSTTVNGDGKADSTLHYEGEHPGRLEEDSNFDGQPDRFTQYKLGKALEGGARPRLRRPHRCPRAELARDGTKQREQQDTNGDGKLDLAIYYEGPRKVRIEEDTRADGKVDVDDPFLRRDKEQVTRREADTSGDGHFDTVALWRGRQGNHPADRRRCRWGQRARGPPRPRRPEGARGDRPGWRQATRRSSASTPAVCASVRRRIRPGTPSPRW